MAPVVLPLDHGGPAERPFEEFPAAALDGCVSDRFAAIAARFADRLAVADRVRRLDYAELAGLAADIAAAADAAALGRPGPIAILLAAEARYPAAMLGALAAGRGYVPLDAGFPPARNRRIAAHAGVALAISAGDLAAEARDLFAGTVPVLDLDSLPAGAPQPPDARPGPRDLAYIVYTSGSTGAPKGVYQNQRNLLHDVMQYTNALHLDCTDRLTLLYSPSVAGAIPDIWGALLNGASLHVLPPRELGPAGLAREIRARGITIYHSVPTLGRRVVEALAAGERFESVRLAYLSGDRVLWSDVDVFRRGFPQGAYLYLALNSTESARTCCHWFMDERLRGDGSRLPVGRELPDRRLSLVDADGAPVADGEIGEFVVDSRYVALGYWRAPEATAGNFATLEDGVTRRLYTGDLGRRRPDGLYEFRGRKDERVKLHGHGIEPAEIEMALAACPGIRDAAVVVRRDAAGAPRALAAYVEPEAGTRGLLPRHVSAMLAQSLPRHMLPAPVFVLDALPRLANFKIDRLRLGEIDAARSTDAGERAADPLLDRVARTYEETLAIEGATADDTLNSLGGDSLQVIDLALALAERFTMEFPVELLEATSIRDLARWIADRGGR